MTQIIYNHDSLDRNYFKENLISPPRFPTQIHRVVSLSTTPVAYKIWAYYSKFDKNVLVNLRTIIDAFEDELWSYPAIKQIVSDLKRSNLASAMKVEGKWDLLELTFKSWVNLFRIEKNILEKFL